MQVERVEVGGVQLEETAEPGICSREPLKEVLGTRRTERNLALQRGFERRVRERLFAISQSSAGPVYFERCGSTIREEGSRKFPSEFGFEVEAQGVGFDRGVPLAEREGAVSFVLVLGGGTGRGRAR